MSSSNNSGYITVDQANKMLLKQNTVNTSRDPRAYSKVAIPPISTNLDTSDRTSGISPNSSNNSGASAYSMASGIPRNQLTSGFRNGSQLLDTSDRTGGISTNSSNNSAT